MSSDREVKNYPDTLMAQIPINYLLQVAQQQQQAYAGLFSPLLRYIHFNVYLQNAQLALFYIVSIINFLALEFFPSRN